MEGDVKQQFNNLPSMDEVLAVLTQKEKRGIHYASLAKHLDCI
jgi:hypothetical protein